MRVIYCMCGTCMHGMNVICPCNRLDILDNKLGILDDDTTRPLRSSCVSLIGSLSHLFFALTAHYYTLPKLFTRRLKID